MNISPFLGENGLFLLLALVLLFMLKIEESEDNEQKHSYNKTIFF